MSHRRTLIFLGLIIFISAVIRFWKLPSLSFPPNGDEVAYGYYGWSLLHYGTDEYGHKYPLSFQSIGDYKYPGLAYLNILPAALFGLTPLEIRFVGAVSGVLLVPLIFLLAYYLFSNSKIALWSAFLSAVCPWDIIETRLGYESHPALIILLAGLLLLLYARRSRLRLGLSFFLFVFSTFTFAAERLFAPAILLILFIFYRRSRYILFCLGVSIIVALSLISPAGRGRAGDVMWSGLSHDQLNHLQEIYVSAGLSPTYLPARITWLFHNKYLLTLTDFTSRYLDHFSPSFLFFQGEATEERIPDMGVLLLSDIVLLPLGFLYLRSRAHSSKWPLLISWLLLAPVASALTSGGAHITRGTLLIIPFSLLSAVGLTSLPRLLKPLAVIAVIFCFGLAAHQLFVVTPTLRPWYPKQAYAQVVQTISRLKSNYSAVVIGGDDYIYYLFYQRITPNDFIAKSDISPLTAQQKWDRVNRLDNINFKLPFKCPKSGKAGVLYVCTGSEIPQNAKLLHVIYYLDKIPAYTFISFYPLSQRPSPLPVLPENLQYQVEVESNPEFPDGLIPTSHPGFW